MSHQPYETWMFEKDRLSPEQGKVLKEHIRNCPHCQNLEQAWDDVNLCIRSAPMVKPQQGFSERWRFSLGTRRELKRRNQMWNFFLSLTATTFFFLLFLGNQILIAGSPVDWAVSIIQGTIHSITDVWKTLLTVSGWVQFIPSEIKFSVFFSLIMTLFILSSLWFYMVLNIQKFGEKNYEVD